MGGASLFEIWTNDPAECVLTVKSSDFLFREAVVTVMGGEVIINPTGGMIVIPVRVRQQIALDSRLSLPLKRSPAPTHGPSPFPLFRCEGSGDGGADCREADVLKCSAPVVSAGAC